MFKPPLYSNKNKSQHLKRLRNQLKSYNMHKKAKVYKQKRRNHSKFSQGTFSDSGISTSDETQNYNNFDNNPFAVKTPPKWEAVQCFGFNSASKSNTKTLVDKTKYKTEICRQWSRNQTCSYGMKCQFAHGKYELVQKSIPNMHYKSKKCKSYHQKGTCSYGIRCKFIHDLRDINDVKKFSYYQEKLAFCQFGNNQYKRERLPVFQEITQQFKESVSQNQNQEIIINSK